VAPLLKAAFDMAADEDPVVETIAPNQRFAVLAIGRALPAAPPPLAQIAPIVKADLVRKRASDRAKASRRRWSPRSMPASPPRVLSPKRASSCPRRSR
jgi:peptidyl-prolyl cis-trans isomerase D